ncbi:MAG: cupin domain-containing protein [Alphaproteobacteria bacterium]
MKATPDSLPQARDALGDMVRGREWGEMIGGVLTFPEGTDFCPLLQGLEGDHCQCPHWGYVLKGRIKVDYQDGTTETVTAGELYYWPPGHTVLFEEDTQYVEFSPKDEMNAVLDHVVAKMGS